MVEDAGYLLKNPFVLSAVAVALVVYFGLVPVGNQQAFCSLNESPVEITGNIDSNPSKTSSGKFYSFKLRADSCAGILADRKVVSSCSGTQDVLVPCHIVEALYPGKLYSAAGQGILFEQGTELCVEGYMSGDYFVCTSARKIYRESAGIWSFLLEFRGRLRLAFRRLMFSWGNAGGLVLSLLSGSREYLDDRVRLAFKAAGLSHILALSGMHLNFFSGIGSRVSTAVIGKKYQGIPMMGAVAFFIYFAGLTPSLFRALLCCIFGRALRRYYIVDSSGFSLLCGAFLIHVMIYPYHMKEAAFMLSYGALAGIFLFSDLFIRVFTPVFLPWIAESLAASVSAQLFTFPVSAVLFGEIMPVGIVAAVFVGPFINLFMFMALLSLIICLCIPFLSPCFGYIMNLIYAPIEFFVTFFSGVPSIKF